MCVGIVPLSLLVGCGPPRKVEVVAPDAKITPTPALPSPFNGFAFVGGGKCAMDAVNGSKDQAQQIEYPLKGGLVISGWAFDEAHKLVPEAIALQLAGPAGTFHAVAERKSKRPDLAKLFGEPAYVDSGYGVDVDTAALPAGTYDVLLIMKGTNVNLVCSTYRRVKLTG